MKLFFCLKYQKLDVRLAAKAMRKEKGLLTITELNTTGLKTD